MADSEVSVRIYFFANILPLFERNFRYKEQQRVTYKINFF